MVYSLFKMFDVPEPWRMSAREWRVHVREHKPLTPAEFWPRYDRQESLQAYALQISDLTSNRLAAGMLNVTPQTVAAWRAHQTMGTYDRA